MGKTQYTHEGGKQPEGESQIEKRKIKSNRVKMKEFRKKTFKCVEGHSLLFPSHLSLDSF